jgi:hypothetical protein
MTKKRGGTSRSRTTSAESPPASQQVKQKAGNSISARKQKKARYLAKDDDVDSLEAALPTDGDSLSGEESDMAIMVEGSDDELGKRTCLNFNK